MRGMTFQEITVAFESKLIEVLGADARIVFPNQDVDFSQSTDILAIQKVAFGETFMAELGAPDALSQMVGAYLVNLSVKQGQSLSSAKALAQRVFFAFRRVRLECLVCGEPWLRDVGQSEDGRYSLVVNIPWSMYFNTSEKSEEGKWGNVLM